jgi:hypothetical protein
VRWAGTAHAGEEREERRGRRAGRVLGRGKREKRERRGVEGNLGRGAAHAGRGGEGRPEGEKGRGVLGWARCSPFFSFLLSFFFTQSIQTNYLNSNRFEFKPYKLNTRKIMLQHECTNMLTL